MRSQLGGSYLVIGEGVDLRHDGGVGGVWLLQDYSVLVGGVDGALLESWSRRVEAMAMGSDELGLMFTQLEQGAPIGDSPQMVPAARHHDLGTYQRSLPPSYLTALARNAADT